jgi:NADH-quinone oxidoreductase subunit J
VTISWSAGATTILDEAPTIPILATLLGGLGMWLMLPRGATRGRGLGAMLAAIALGLAASQMPALGDWVDQSVFFILAAVTILSAIGAVTFRNPLYCAIWFGQMLLGTAGLFLFTGAQFLAVATIVVYAGAILVTFLFVLMLAQPEGKAAYDRVSWEAMLAASGGVAILAVLSLTIGRVFARAKTVGWPAAPTPRELAGNILTTDHVARLGGELFGRYLIAIEVTGVLLLVAVVGAAVIIGREKR